MTQCIDFAKKELTRASNSTPTKGKSEPLTNGEVSVENAEGSASINVDSMRSLLGNTISIVHSLGGNASIPGQAKRVDTGPAADQLPRVRGLSNLGNTCFFNAVMQCLARTPFLLPTLKELSAAGEEFELPGGKLKMKDSDVEIDLPPIKGTLSAWEPLTSALAETIEELQVSGGVYNPRKLFSNLTKIWPQFAGGDQHDSHELLRHLLESVKSEDSKRYKRVILKELNFSEYRGKDSSNVPEEMKQKIKFYGQQVADRILCPEQVFRGFLVSTLTCQECYHTSSRHENFLDLSLPVCVDKPAPPIRRKSTPDEVSPTKEKPAKTKATRKSNNRSTESEDTDADDEDNDSEGTNLKRAQPSQRATDSNGNEVNEKQDDGPEFTDKDKHESHVKNELLELGISVKGGQKLANQASQEDEVIATTSAEPDHTHLTESFEQLKLADKKSRKNKAKRKRLVSHTDWSSTIAPRYQCEDGEFSVQSCLNNFTALELMTGNNKVGCDSCSERINGKGGKTINTTATKQFLISSPPAVLILHLKRFQVGPRFMFRKLSKHVTFPFVLDLAPSCASKVKTLPNVHRHQKKLLYSLYGIVEHSGSMHGGHYVAYVKVRPNIAPDDPRWKFLPKGAKLELDQTDEQKQRLDEALKKNQLKESRMKSGDSDDSTSSSDSGNAGEEHKTTLAEPAVNVTSNSPEPPVLRPPPDGKWYYVSDSHVSEVNEERVLGAQAYLLFYERIY